MSQKKSSNLRNRGIKKDETTAVSVGCLAFYDRGGGCKVGADVCQDFTYRRQSNISDEVKGYISRCGNEEATFDCFSNSVKDKFSKKSDRRIVTISNAETSNGMDVHFPDDVLEACLIRLPLRSLMNARLVCKKWRNLTSTPRFMQIRRDGLFQTPWLFLFGVVKDGCCSGEIHALDVSLNEWHRIDSHVLKGRFLFSVTSLQEDVYVVGGCSSLTNFGRVDRSSFKTHKGVLVFSPITKSWRKAAAMKYARSSPILGVSEVSMDCVITKTQQSCRERHSYRPRVGGTSEVYEDPHRLSIRRHSRHSIDGNDIALYPNKKPNENDIALYPNKKPNEVSKGKNVSSGKKFVMIAVGGHGSWDEALDSVEIYDSTLNKWTEIQRLPHDFGMACSGAICNGKFYVCSESDKLVSYDIEKGYWVRIQTTSCPPRVQNYYPKVISCLNRLFMLSVSWCEGSGLIGRRNKAVRKLWALDLTSLAWKEVCVHPDAPMDWNAAFVADKRSIFGVEMFKIFGQVLDFVTMLDVSDTGRRWRHVSRNHVVQELDPSSCMTKSMAVVRL